MKPENRPRFIAGVTCPQCGEMDTIQHWPERDEIACISCDFRQSAQQRDKQTIKASPEANQIPVKMIDQ